MPKEVKTVMVYGLIHTEMLPLYLRCELQANKAAYSAPKQAF